MQLETIKKQRNIMAKTEQKIIDKVFVLLGIVMIGVLLTTGALALYGSHFATSMVKNELSQQKIYFPAADSAAIAALPSADQTEMKKYAGQQLTTGEQAKVYANNYINVHLQKIADGKTYAEVSELAMKDPGNQKLQTQRTTLFQGETLRGLLLGSGYAYGTFGKIAQYAAIAAFVGAGLMSLLVILGVRRLNR